MFLHALFLILEQQAQPNPVGTFDSKKGMCHEIWPNSVTGNWQPNQAKQKK